MSMYRRDVLKSIGGLSLLSLAAPAVRAQEQLAQATRGMSPPRIKDISVIECAPAGARLTVVKITTDQDGLYGRSTQGVKLLNLEEDDKVAAAVVIPPEEAKAELEDGTLLQ